MAASTSRHGPIKGILKNKTSVLAPEEQPCRSVVDEEELGKKKSQKWDEMNILATCHPAGKDCGLRTALEAGARCPHAVGGDEDDARRDAAAETFAEKLAAAAAAAAAAAQGAQPKRHECRGGEAPDLSPEEQEKRRQFEVKRKLHDSEGLNIQLARQLLSKDLREEEEEEEEEEEDEEMPEATDGECMNTEEPDQGSMASDHPRQSRSQSP